MKMKLKGKRKQENKIEFIVHNSNIAHYNPEINWKTRKVKIMRCPDKCEK